MKLADIVLEIYNLDETSQQRLLAYLQTSVGLLTTLKTQSLKNLPNE
ncbi:hypothetical protein J6TS2_38190 [Heyndrickxia sporothermodurans]|nr:hypothetical protein J6TS2_38190 [Heyndrickxia sporothermodurans]